MHETFRSRHAVIRGDVTNTFKDQLKHKFSNDAAFGIIQQDIVQYHVKTPRI